MYWNNFRFSHSLLSSFSLFQNFYPSTSPSPLSVFQCPTMPHTLLMSLYLVVCVSPSFSFFFCSLSLYMSLFLSFSLIFFSLVPSLSLFLFLSFSASTPLSLNHGTWLVWIQVQKVLRAPPLPTQIPFLLPLSPHKGIVFVLGPRECS